MCSNVIVLEAGKIIYDGLISELMKQHKSNKYRSQVHIKGDFLFPEHFVELSREDNDIFLEFDAEKSDELMSLVQSQNFRLVSLYPKHLSLEEVIYRIEQ